MEILTIANKPVEKSKDATDLCAEISRKNFR